MQDLDYTSRLDRYRKLPVYEELPMDWQSEAQLYLAKLMKKRYDTALALWLKQGKPRSKFINGYWRKQSLPRAIDDMVNALGRNDKEMFYGIKLKITMIPESITD